MIINADGSNHVYEPRTEIDGVPNENWEALHEYVRIQMNQWCDVNDDTLFSVRHLFGGKNFDWNYTPLQSIVNHFVLAQHSESTRAASQSVGLILKNVVHCSPRTFTLYILPTTYYKDVNHYTWQCDYDRQISELIGAEIR